MEKKKVEQKNASNEHMKASTATGWELKDPKLRKPILLSKPDKKRDSREL